MGVPPILRLDVTGRPMCWIDWQEAACLYARAMVAWTAGRHEFDLHGGQSRLTGRRTVVRINSIIAVRGEFRGSRFDAVPPLTNRELFRRDHNLCLYCGQPHSDGELTRDHVVPVSRGGGNGWANVVSACRRCNTRKADRTPEEAGMPLLAVPYVPNVAEYLALRNRRILADQMDFLKSQFRTPSRRWHKAPSG